MITRKNNAFVEKIVNTRLTKIFMAIFAPHERLPSSATLLLSGVVEDLSSALALSILLNTSVSASPGKTVLTPIPGNGYAEEEEGEKNPRSAFCHYFLRSCGIKNTY